MAKIQLVIACGQCLAITIVWGAFASPERLWNMFVKTGLSTLVSGL
jgi:hypothetical protein